MVRLRIMSSLELVTLLWLCLLSILEMYHCMIYLLVNISKMVPKIMSKIPDDTATQDIDHFAFRWQQHFVGEASLVTGGRPVGGGRITKGEDTESWLLNTLLSESVIVLSSSGTMVDIVEGTERISIPCSGSAMIRLNLGGCEDERPFSSLERAWKGNERHQEHHRGKASPTNHCSVIQGVRRRILASLPNYYQDEDPKSKAKRYQNR